MPAPSLTLSPQGPFSLAASARFLEGFAAGAVARTGEPALRLAFPVEGGWETAGAHITQRGGELDVQVTGAADPAAVKEQVARMLSVDVDASDFEEVGARDPVAADLQRRYPGLRPLGFWSAYEAACWALLSHRIRMTQAARLKQRLAEQHGQPVEVGGRRMTAFPAPGVLRELDRVEGIPARKLEWLRAIADAALAGSLDGSRLRALAPEVALAELQELPGIGPFSAELVLLRGAAHPDVFPRHERRLHLAMAAAYRLGGSSPEALAAIAERWRPYRTWIAFLLRVRRDEEMPE